MYLGKYKTILYLSIVYFIGTLFTTYSSLIVKSPFILFWGLGLISLGTGGIKPCVAAFGGDQIDGVNDQKKREKFFEFFYFAINLGSMISSFLVPLLAEWSCLGNKTCYPLAFGSSSVLLLISIAIFILGSSHYIKIKPNKNRFLKLIADINEEKAEDNSENISNEIHRNQTKDFSYMNILKLFIPIVCFWMLYDQQSSTWIEQGFKMSTTASFGSSKFKILSSQMQTWNSIFILCFIPLFTKYLYPTIEYFGWKLTPIKKMGCGIMLASLSFLSSAYLEHKIIEYATRKETICILWQLPQYLLLTAGEILLNMTGLEFVYSESPESLKTLILAGWLLTVTVGNIFVILYSFIDLARIIKPSEPETFNFLVYSFLGISASLYLFKFESKYKKNIK
ncbi:solute carrier family 15 member [Vairimorpha necatrix]|uniref:Solute carrier family 15 member n=1 Tax=Vairimorpha necatrix TaxID=6039 RepID=A0AAX4J8M1_9MICR